MGVIMGQVVGGSNGQRKTKFWGTILGFWVVSMNNSKVALDDFYVVWFDAKGIIV